MTDRKISYYEHHFRSRRGAQAVAEIPPPEESQLAEDAVDEMEAAVAEVEGLAVEAESSDELTSIDESVDQDGDAGAAEDVPESAASSVEDSVRKRRRRRRGG